MDGLGPNIFYGHNCTMHINIKKIKKDNIRKILLIDFQI